jgi:hypothetical protein
LQNVGLRAEQVPGKYRTRPGRANPTCALA